MNKSIDNSVWSNDKPFLIILRLIIVLWCKLCQVILFIFPWHHPSPTSLQGVSDSLHSYIVTDYISKDYDNQIFIAKICLRKKILYKNLHFINLILHFIKNKINLIHPASILLHNFIRRSLLLHKFVVCNILCSKLVARHVI